MKTKGISDQARLLHSALIQRGVNVELEKWDDHKHIDLSIEDASLYIEIDGDHHYTKADVILQDLKRDYFSNEDGYDTVRIPNYIVENNIDAVADAISKVVEKRISGD